MKKFLTFILLAVFALSACGPKPQYKTRKGKKKQKYYNSIQYQTVQHRQACGEIEIIRI